MKHARIRHQKDFPQLGEGYVVEILVKGEWHFESFFGLQHGIMDNIDDERNFIHFSILNKIRNLADLDYSISIS